MSNSSKRAALPLFNFALAIAMGAFCAHALKSSLSEYGLEVFNTSKDYHMWVGIVWIVLALSAISDRTWKWLTWVLGIGTILFCGSLYLLAVTNIKVLGAITPLGGATWIIGFTALGISALKGSLLVESVHD
ncbi:MAG: DUF423 domain-containing protein [Fimbriimonadaceae bacterium]|nr:MAG: DUF423 domain-containing protein [Fimbriimonadaceae bacterium]